MPPEISMREFFKGSHVLITGATGFLGKVLIEKILRSCPDVAKLYLLIRCKKGKSEEVRLKELLDDVVFDRLPKECPDYLNKIEMIPGDCSMKGLGLSQEDRQKILLNVNIVFHGAATVRFDENLKTAVAINVAGTREIILLSRELQQLKALVHISTAYSNCNRDLIEEQFYEPPPCSERILEMASLLTHEEMAKLTPELLHTWPNTYALTKALGEHLVKHEEGIIPACVFRPSIVVSTAEEPVPGWIDNLYGPTGMVVGIGCGVIRVVQADVSADANLVPVDLTVNAILTAARQTYIDFRSGETEVKIYNYESINENPLRWKDYLNILNDVGLRVPSAQAVWYYSLTISKYWPIVWLLSFLLHFLPAYIIDAVALILGKKPQMVRVYEKVAKFTAVLSYFSTRRYKFTNDNVRHLISSSSGEDKKLFNMDIRTVNWRNYLDSYIKGARQYILKESWDTLPYARIKWRRLYWLHQFVKVILIVGACRLVYSILNIIH